MICYICHTSLFSYFEPSFKSFKLVILFIWFSVKWCGFMQILHFNTYLCLCTHKHISLLLPLFFVQILHLRLALLQAIRHGLELPSKSISAWYRNEHFCLSAAWVPGRTWVPVLPVDTKCKPKNWLIKMTFRKNLKILIFFSFYELTKKTHRLKVLIFNKKVNHNEMPP